MNSTTDTTTWCRATTLRERLESLRQNSASRGYISKPQHAGKRLQAWKMVLQGVGEEVFHKRLEADSILEAEFKLLLDDFDASVFGWCAKVPSWWNDVVYAYSTESSSVPVSNRAIVVNQKTTESFLQVVEPVIYLTKQRLHDRVALIVKSSVDVPMDWAVMEPIVEIDLRKRLSILLGRTMALELNVARLREQLQGETAEDRFQDFCQRLADSACAMDVLEEYPVLARLIMIVVDNWVDSTSTFVQHLCNDWADIKANFSPAVHAGRVVNLRFGCSDPHRGGKTVCIVEFSCGYKLVYKPKSLAVACHFQQLLQWLNGRGEHPKFRTIDILDCEDHGWSEFVVHQGCENETELRRFYQRQGGFLALLHVLDARDFHYENLIASGEHPVMIDLEALFHPPLAEPATQYAVERAFNEIDDSILRTGLLPQCAWSVEDSERFDISGLGATGEQLTPQPVPRWENALTDRMKLTEKRAEVQPASNRPTLQGRDVNLLEYADDILEGFMLVYQLIQRSANELTLMNGPLSQFANDEVRVIPRPTMYYSQLLYDSYHPDVLRNALDRDRLLDVLWCDVEQFPCLASLVRAEQVDLVRGDIPVFTTRPNRCDVWTSTGERIPSFSVESGLDRAARRIRQLNDRDFQQQAWLIRASLATSNVASSPGQTLATKPAKSVDSERANEAATQQLKLIEAARAVGDRLELMAVRGKHDATWIGMSPVGGGQVSIIPTDLDLFHGLPGIAYFLGYLTVHTGEQKYFDLAISAVNALKRQVKAAKPEMTAVGGFIGWGGVVYALTHLAASCRMPALLDDAHDIVSFLSELIEQDDKLDVLDGSAGCLGSLLAFYDYTESRTALLAAKQCGERLLSFSHEMECGIAWFGKYAGDRPLAGFSHGAAGIAWALTRLACVTGEERYLHAAKLAMDYERSVFSVTERNWPDLSVNPTLASANQSDSPRMRVAWCHGAAGIGLSRLFALPYLNTEDIRNDIDIALSTTMDKGFGDNLSLCHGDLGNIELLIQAAKRLEDLYWADVVREKTSSILHRIERHGWRCGVPFQLETPGLMTGLAGIGYGLLRLADEERIPSVLLMESPVRNGNSITLSS